MTRHELIDALDSPTIAALAQIFSDTQTALSKSYSAQVADILAPRLCNTPAQQPRTVNELAAWLVALEDASMYEPVPDSLIGHARRYIHAGLTEQHSGDCTKQSHSCVVCGTSDAIAKAKQVLAGLGALPEGMRSSVDPDGINKCMLVAAKALDYLSDHERPIGGQSKYNAEHLIQLASELRRTSAALSSTK